MRTNDQNPTAVSGKAAFLSTRRAENRPTPFVFRWRALQHELGLKTARLDYFSAERFEIVAVPRPVPPESGTVSRFGKFLLSNLIAS